LLIQRSETSNAAAGPIFFGEVDMHGAEQQHPKEHPKERSDQSPVEHPPIGPDHYPDRPPEEQPWIDPEPRKMD
jgi:hypothetical protein